MRASRMGIAALVVCAAGVIALADGDTRPATAAERAFTGKVCRVFTAALPAPPQGWTLADSSEPTPPTAVAGRNPRPIEVECRVVWQDAAKARAAQQREMEAFQAVKTDPALEAKQEKLQKQMGALSEQFGAAIQKNDAAGAKRIQDQLQSVSQELQKVLTAQSAGFTAAAKAGEIHDVQAEVSLQANSTYTYLRRGTPESPQAGLPSYRMEPDPKNTQEEGTTAVFLGPWRASPQSGATAMQATSPAGTSTTSVQTLIVRVKGDKARARAILERVNWAALKGLLSR
ncbi:MAG: hypothetical protein WBS54_03295 [Acidobacteriota bacterium]